MHMQVLVIESLHIYACKCNFISEDNNYIKIKKL